MEEGMKEWLKRWRYEIAGVMAVVAVAIGVVALVYQITGYQRRQADLIYDAYSDGWNARDSLKNPCSLGGSLLRWKQDERADWVLILEDGTRYWFKAAYVDTDYAIVFFPMAPPDAEK
jgi:hypothetical protein